MPAPQRNDPYKSFNFRVEIDGIAHAAFSEVTGLESETAVIEYRAGGENVVRKLPGLTKFGNIVLRRGDDKRNEVVRWNFHDGWICKWDGPAFNARSNEVAIETIEIAHEGLERA